MTGYVRKDTTNNIADGNVINASDLDAEFDGVKDAFQASTGHKHDGTTGEGAPITSLGPNQDVTISATLLAPKTTNTVDIGSSALKFKDLFLAGNGSIGGTLAVTGVATLTANPVFSGGTANGVLYLNASKVVTSGSALTFDGTKLGIASGNIDVVSPSFSGAPVISARFNSSNDRMGFNIANSNGFPFLGYNVNNASASDSGTFDRNGYATRLRLDNGKFQFETSTASGTAGNAITFTQAMTLDASGNLYLGATTGARGGSTTRQLVKLGSGQAYVEIQSASTSSTSDAIMFSDGSTGNYGLLGYNHSNDSMNFYTAATERARITSGGNLLIGTTDGAMYDTNAGSDVSQFYKFISTGGGTSQAYGFTVSNGGSDAAMGLWGLNSASKRLRIAGILGQYTSSTAGSEASVMTFSTMGSGVLSERARIDSSGNLLINTTSRASSERLSVWGTGASDVIFVQTAGGTGYVYKTSTSAGLAAYFQTSAGQAGLIEATGNSTNYTSGSDYRLKDNIRPIDNALAKVASMKPVAFEWKSNGSYGESFIAHELAEVCPQAVVGEKDAVNEDGTPNYQSIDTSFLVATLTAAIQEQQAIIESLKARLDAANL
jgi:hypothetical protein